jgi:glucose-1-phosphate cytidylyltransferase
VKLVLLCGGQGTRMREETEFRPKPMVEIGGRPILWHIMKLYAAADIREFVLCLGYRGAMIKDYFLHYHAQNSDISLDVASGEVELHRRHLEDWRVTLVDTGLDTMTGARVKRIAHYVGDDELFLCTYGDGLADLDIRRLLAFHRAHGRLATVTGVAPPARFGRLFADGSTVATFAEKPAEGSERINGGFFVFDRRVLDRIGDDPSCVLEREPLEQLAREQQLMVYEHDGFWQCADTVRDVELLRGLWDAGTAPWRLWDDRELARPVDVERRAHGAGSLEAAA